jgi:hypothetical protein
MAPSAPFRVNQLVESEQQAVSAKPRKREEGERLDRLGNLSEI